MSIREIVTYPAEVLRRPTEVVTRFDAELDALIDDMFETMYAAPGVGLAAPQVGVGKRVFVMDPDTENRDGALAVVNAQIVDRRGEVVSDEGCLSIPGFTADVTRAAAVRMVGHDRHGRPLELDLEGFPAVVVQHEIDHLDGVLFVDYLGSTRWRFFERDYGRDPFRWRFAGGRR